MDTISVLVGFLIGVVATMIAVEFGLKKIFRPPAMNKVTGAWRLEDHKAPLVVTQDAGDTPFPTGARVVTAGTPPPGLSQNDQRRNPNARSNFIVDREMDRALVFMGPIREGTLAMATLDPAVVARLRAEHRRLWDTGSPCVKDVAPGELVRNMGLIVRVRGRVQECVAYRDQHLLRITDGTQVAAAVVEEPLDLAGKTVWVTGRVVRGTSGHPLLEADEVRLEGTTKSVGQARSGQAAGAQATRAAEERPGAQGMRPVDAPATVEDVRDVKAPSRVLRVPAARPAPDRVTGRVAVPEGGPEPDPMEFEPVETEEAVTTEADRRRRRARVTLHR